MKPFQRRRRGVEPFSDFVTELVYSEAAAWRGAVQWHPAIRNSTVTAWLADGQMAQVYCMSYSFKGYCLLTVLVFIHLGQFGNVHEMWSSILVQR